MADLARQQLDFDAAAVAWTELDTLDDPFTALTDPYTVFLVQNNGVGALALVIPKLVDTIQTVFGKVDVEDMTLSVPADAAVYCFRVPPQVYANGAGVCSINPGAAPDAVMACLRLVPEHACKGAVEFDGVQPEPRVAVLNALAAVTGVAVSSLDTVRKGHNAIWLAKNATGADVLLALQTSDVNVGKNFGRLYGYMENVFSEAPTVDFLVHPVTIPHDSEWYAFIRPIGAYDGSTGGDAADIGILCEDDLTLARLDMGLAYDPDPPT